MQSATRVFVYEYLSAGGRGDATMPADLLESGTSMREALVADFTALDDIIVSRATRRGERAARRSNRIVDVSPADGEDAVAFVSRHAKTHDVVLVVAPETDGILAALRGCVGRDRWLGCSGDAITLASSKRATRRHLASHAIATPAAWEPGQRVPADSDAGWVVKPDDGAGALDTHWFERFDQAHAELSLRLERGQPATLEAWVSGEPLSLSLLCGSDVRLLSINRQHIAVDQRGGVRYEGVSVAAIDPRSARAAPLVELGHRVARAIGGLRGFVGIDVVDAPARGPVAVEVNPRVTCAYVGLSAALGRNLAHEMLEQHRASTRDHAAA